MAWVQKRQPSAVFFELVYDVKMLQELRKRDVKLGRQTINRLHFYGSIFLVLIIALFIGRVYISLLEPRKDFFNELWAPAYLLVHGQSPYDTSMFNPISPAAWLPMSIGFFYWLGWLEDTIALRAWFIASLFQLGFMVFLVQGKHRPLHVSLISGLFVFSFPPALYHLILGQFSLITTTCLILALHSVTKQRHWLTAFLLALALSKPQLCTVFIFGLSIYYFKQARWRGLLSFWARVLSMIVVLCLPLFIAHLNWIPDAVASMRANPYWLYPSLFIVFKINLGVLGVWAWALLALAVLGLGIILWNNFPLSVAGYWSLALALFITPYIGSWDFVILLPLWIFTFSKVHWGRKIFLIISFLLAWYGMNLVQRMESSDNYFFWWVPPWFMTSAALVTDWKDQIRLKSGTFPE